MKLLLLLGLVMLIIVVAWAHWPITPLPPGPRPDLIIVEKARRTLTLYCGNTPLRSYPVSLGRVPVGPKEREGDLKTPEGLYTITEHKADSSYHRALRVSYPEAKDVARAKQLGVNAGFDIMVHGLPNGLGFFGRLHRFRDWTAGCIALTNAEIDQIYSAVPRDIAIEIRP